LHYSILFYHLVSIEIEFRSERWKFNAKLGRQFEGKTLLGTNWKTWVFG